jgi:hypothetical protein
LNLIGSQRNGIAARLRSKAPILKACRNDEKLAADVVVAAGYRHLCYPDAEPQNILDYKMGRGTEVP